MRRHQGARQAVRAWGLVAATAVVVGALACLPGCSAPGGDQPGQPSPATAAVPSPSATTVVSPPTDPGQVDASDPEAVADAVAVTVAVRDGAADTSPTDSQARASRWYSPELGSIQEGEEVERPDSHWVVLTSRQAHDVVESLDRASDTVPSQDGTVWLTRTVTTRAESADGWQGARRTTRYWLTLTRAGDGSWQVSAISSQQVDPG